MADHDPLLLPAPEEPLLLAPPSATSGAGGGRHVKKISAIALAAFLLIAFAFGWFLHHRRSSAAEQSTREAADAMPMVNVVAVKRSTPLSDLLLPGSLSPLTEASLYARAAGYVTRRYVDIGDTVREGQVLLDIESPELDQQVLQGVAATAQAQQQLGQVRTTVADAKAKLDLAQVTMQRYDTLLTEDAATAQDVDQRHQAYVSAQAALAAAEANVGAAVANVRAVGANQGRLVALQKFERLRAPFTGVITARSVDEGALISGSGASSSGGTGSTSSTSTSSASVGSSSGSTSSDSDAGGSGGSSGGSSGSPLFRIARIDRLRVYVNVPQSDSAAIQLGSDAAVQVQEFEKPFAGRVSRTAHALDPSARTLLTEVQIDNSRQTLMPGMYAQVRFSSARSNPPILIPGEALIARADGMQVATVGPIDAEQRRRLPASPDDRCARAVRFQHVAVGRDYGTEVEITQGLRPGDLVVVNASDAVQDKSAVLPLLQKNDGGQGGKGGAAAKADDKSKGKGSSKGDKRQGEADDEAARRRTAQRSCVEEQARAEASTASASAAPAGQSVDAQPAPASAPGGASDRTPSGMQSPSMKAPTQGQGGKKP